MSGQFDLILPSYFLEVQAGLALFLHEVVQSDCQFQSQDCLPGVALSLCLAALPFVLQGTGLPTVNQLGPDAVAAWLACRGLGLLRGPSASDCGKLLATFLCLCHAGTQLVAGTGDLGAILRCLWAVFAIGLQVQFH